MFKITPLLYNLTENHAASARSSIVLMILAMLEPGPPIAPAMPAEGAAIQFTIVAMSSSRLGILETAVTPARSNAFSPIAPPRITKLSLSLEKSSATLAAATGSSEKVRTVMPVNKSAMLAHGLSFRAILASLFFATRTAAPASDHLRAQVLHLSNCHTLVAANHHNARAFKDLTEVFDQFLFLGSIHSFTPIYEGPLCPLGSV